MLRTETKLRALGLRHNMHLFDRIVRQRTVCRVMMHWYTRRLVMVMHHVGDVIGTQTIKGKQLLVGRQRL